MKEEEKVSQVRTFTIENMLWATYHIIILQEFNHILTDDRLR